MSLPTAGFPVDIPHDRVTTLPSRTSVVYGDSRAGKGIVGLPFIRSQYSSDPPPLTGDLDTNEPQAVRSRLAIFRVEFAKMRIDVDPDVGRKDPALRAETDCRTVLVSRNVALMAMIYVVFKVP